MYLDKEITKEELIEKIKMETRRYAKRQLTWFKRIENVIWLDMQEPEKDNLRKVVEEWNS